MNKSSTTVQGVTITRDDVLKAMDRFDSELRATYPLRKWKKYAVRHNDKDYPPKDVLRLATGLVTIPGGGPPTNRHFEQLGFTVIFRDEEGASVDQLTQDFNEEDEASISLEADIEDALVSNLAQLESGLRLYRENDRTGQQFRINFDANKQGRIDILATDTSGDFVVIEIKAGEADRDVCGQIQGYMGWVKQHLAGQRRVRGVIIASDFTVRAVYAAKVVTDLSLKRYQVSFRFIDG
jgi:hypothetical protein